MAFRLQMKLRTTSLLAGVVALAATLAPPAWSQARPIRIIVPYAAGGPIDVTARVLAERVKDSLGPVIIENRPGAGGNIGADAVAKAAPDGLTVGIAATATHAVNPWLYSKMPYDAAKDFAPITQMLRVPNVLVMNADTANRLKISTVNDLIAYAKANPGKLNYGSQGTGSAGHLVMERIKALTGINLVHVPYRGAAPAYNDLLGGQIQLMSVSLGAMPYIKAGKMRAIGIGSAQRSPLLPDVPTYIEEGLPGFVSGVWFGIAAPANTPKDIVNRLSAEFKAAIAKPEVAERLRGLGTEPEYLPGPEFGSLATKDFEQWGKVIRDNNIKLE